MNSGIKKLNKRIELFESKRAELVAGTTKDLNDRINDLNDQLKKEYETVFKKDADLKTALKDIETSNEYGSDESGIYSWVRFYLTDYKDDSQGLEFLSEYVSEAGYHLDAENESLVNFQGDCILINDDGDIFESDGVCPGKDIASIDDYSVNEEPDEALRNKLIRDYMESNEYWPGVFTVDHYGNVYSVNTEPVKSSTNVLKCNTV